MSRSTLLLCFEKIVDIIEKKSKQVQTIGDLLSKYPIKTSISKGTMMSIDMFQSGKEVQQIALERYINFMFVCIFMYFVFKPDEKYVVS